jgi:hypothetical protein
VLTQAGLSGPMREADLSGAALGDAGLKGIVFDGAAMGGVVATGAGLDGSSMIEVSAPRLTAPQTPLRGIRLRAANLDEADFAGGRLIDTRRRRFARPRHPAQLALPRRPDRGDAGRFPLGRRRVGRASMAVGDPLRDDPPRRRRPQRRP